MKETPRDKDAIMRNAILAFDIVTKFAIRGTSGNFNPTFSPAVHGCRRKDDN